MTKKIVSTVDYLPPGGTKWQQIVSVQEQGQEQREARRERENLRAEVRSLLKKSDVKAREASRRALCQQRNSFQQGSDFRQRSSFQKEISQYESEIKKAVDSWESWLDAEVKSLFPDLDNDGSKESLLQKIFGKSDE